MVKRQSHICPHPSITSALTTRAEKFKLQRGMQINRSRTEILFKVADLTINKLITQKFARDYAGGSSLSCESLKKILRNRGHV